MKPPLLLVLGGYLVVGVLFGLASQPQQLWSCPGAGEMLYADKQDEGCTGSVTFKERATTFGVGAALWLSLVVASGLTS